ncbi:hypothetical protein [Mycolicibacterium mageritense]|uniref:hypothetical protein n=1 Tax=Mycolicibacterium mageritense TaxID=53462 RepID=UPI0011632AAE|nr:hypothetical protein [Mycolicibacterium mageritense]MCC9181115.1 hypothetical protein [Mycolicibacterium mageritense]QDF19399.1 hypothetical protein SEA_CRACKLEWINK_113 [Mycobacterium phage Cracklewink]
MTTTTAMTWKYDSEMSRAYWADTELYTFRIRKATNAKRDGWEVAIKHTLTTAGVRHSLGQPDIAAEMIDGLKMGKRVVAHFLDIVPDGEPVSPYTAKRALEQALSRVYDEDSRAIVAAYDASTR